MLAMKQREREAMEALFRQNPTHAVQQISKWREHKPKPDEDPPQWDAKPVVFTVKGVKREFFTIGALASALGRRTVTIRSWEDKKILPQSRFRTPTPPKASLPSKTAKGRRLYTREQIEAVIAAAQVSGVYDPSNALNANWAQFTKLVRTAWSSL